MFKKPIYLDYQATTPVDPRVFDVMRPFFMDHFGNPGSRTHEYGDIASDAVEKARDLIAKAINADLSQEIIFTSGATEANNIAIQGMANYLKTTGKNHIITNKIEHKSVLDVVSHLGRFGFEVTFLNPNTDGTLDITSLVNAIRPQTGLISIMHANNEIGSINPIERIGQIAEEHGILFHCDASQTVGKIPVDVKKMKIHMLSLSAHKIYGPKGIGALYIRNSEHLKIEPLFQGGGQEQGIRPGTVAPALVVGLAEAVRVSIENMSVENDRIRQLRDHLLEGLKSKCSDIVINGALENRLMNNLNVSFLGIPSDTFMINLRDKVSVSNGAACTSYEPMPSYVLQAMGIEKDRIESAIRFGLGRFTTLEEIEYAVDCISTKVKNLRSRLVV